MEHHTLLVDGVFGFIDLIKGDYTLRIIENISFNCDEQEPDSFLESYITAMDRLEFRSLRNLQDNNVNEFKKRAGECSVGWKRLTIVKSWISQI